MEQGASRDRSGPSGVALAEPRSGPVVMMVAVTTTGPALVPDAANLVDPRTDDGAGYGWGMVREKVGDQVFVGHSGGYPGHITKSLLDPVSGLTISVLTNAIDGPATQLARGIAQLLAAAAADGGALPASARRWTGRYANPWTVVDVAAVGGRLRSLSTDAWAPLEGADELVEDGDDLLIERGSGYGSVGEPVTRSVDGGLRYGGLSFEPFADLPGGPAHRLGPDVG